jgi:hypothetical protein
MVTALIIIRMGNLNGVILDLTIKKESQVCYEEIFG